MTRAFAPCSPRSERMKALPTIGPFASMVTIGHRQVWICKSTGTPPGVSEWVPTWRFLLEGLIGVT